MKRTAFKVTAKYLLTQYPEEKQIKLEGKTSVSPGIPGTALLGTRGFQPSDVLTAVIALFLVCVLVLGSSNGSSSYRPLPELYIT